MSVFNLTLTGSRDEFDPSGILSTIEHGDQVLVLDSKKLPSDWYKHVLTDFLPEDHPMKNPENQSPLSFPENFSISQDSIPRVLVFTTMMCLSLLSKVRKGNIDGTFDMATKHFTQLFILLVDYKKSSTLCAIGWLPDKKVLSYHLYFLLLLREFKERFPNDKVTLWKLKLDFEESMHQALQCAFKLCGCHFHFG